MAYDWRDFQLDSKVQFSDLPPDQQAALQDLNWAMFSPPVVEFEDFDFVPTPDQLSQRPVVDTAHLLEFLTARHSYRVGYYFENLIEYWLVHIRQVRDFQRRVVISDQQRTVGELDFLFRDASNAVHHWEVAVKFYLYRQRANAAGSHWIGPNDRDYLERKCDRLLTHQLPLSGQLFDEPIVRTLRMPGILFLPLIDTVTYTPPASHTPAFVNPNGLRGCWMSIGQLPLTPPQWTSRMFCLCEKPHWLSNRQTIGQTIYDWNQIRERIEAHFDHATTPLLLNSFIAEGNELLEAERLFIVQH